MGGRLVKVGLTRVGRGIVDVPSLHIVHFWSLSKSKKAMGERWDKKGSKYQKLGEAANNRRNVASSLGSQCNVSKFKNLTPMTSLHS